MPKVVIVGAGLVGSLNACFFAKRQWQVEVYEARADIRKMEHVQGRSINLALSIRGKAALDYVDLEQYIASQGVEMHARLVHNVDGITFSRQPYGHPGQHIISINRRHLNEVMISQAEKFENVTFFFEHKARLVNVAEGTVTVESLKNGETIIREGDLICGCDGAYSALRRSLMAYPKFNFSQEYIEHGYIELNILPKNDQFAMEPNVFHLWPRGDLTMIALANIDKTFTVTLFAPFETFEKCLCSDQSVLDFFQEHFPDALPLIGRKQLVETFQRQPPLPMLSVKCSPHHFGQRVILLGDAAHAMVPFYGQGMNCGFEDCLVLSEILDLQKSIPESLKLFSEMRCPDAMAINDLAIYNYMELRDLVNHRGYKLRKKFDLLMNRLFPNIWVPLYGMVTFSRIRYHQAIEDRKWQQRMINRSCLFIGSATAILIGGVIVKICYASKLLPRIVVKW